MSERLTMQEVIEHCDKTTRLMERVFTCVHDGGEFGEIESKGYLEHKQTSEWLRELQKYKELEEQGRLIDLPCAVGDTVWFIGRKCVTCDEDDCYGCPHNRNGERKNEKFLYITTIKQFEITKNAVYMIDTDTVWSSTENSFNIDEIGKTVFLTKEAAEAKLKELRGEQE